MAAPCPWLGDSTTDRSALDRRIEAVSAGAVGLLVRCVYPMASKTESEVLTVAGREVTISNPRRCCSRRPVTPSSISCATTSPSPTARCAAPAAGRTCSCAIRTASTASSSTRSARRSSRPAWIEVVALQLSVRPHRRRSRAARRGGARVDGEPRLPRAAPASGARRRSRSSRRAARRSRSGARRRVAADPRGRARRARDARRLRARRLAEDLRLARHSRLRAHRAALDVRRGAARRAGARARSRAARAGARDEQVVEGRAPRRVPRLQPEREGPHGCRARTRCGRSPTRACRRR